jgi:hypothetical protein
VDNYLKVLEGQNLEMTTGNEYIDDVTTLKGLAKSLQSEVKIFYLIFRSLKKPTALLTI